MSDDDVSTLAQRLLRVLARLRDWAGEYASQLARIARRHGRDVKGQMIRGVSYGVGSGAVSLLVVWWENRH